MAEVKIPHDNAIEDAPDLLQPELEVTTVKGRGAPRGPRKAKPEPEAQHADPSAVQKALHGLFRFAAKATKSDAEFQPNEFGAAANGLVDLAKRFPPFNIVLVGLTPVVVVVELVEKVFRVKQGMPPKGAESGNVVRPFPQHPD